MTKTLGILLTNTGTPDSPAIPEVKNYLKAFLSDPRVVRLPKIIWKPLLNAVILPRRAPYAAALYQKIWTAAGSPLKVNMLALGGALQKHLAAECKHPVFVEVGMHYGQPSIPNALSRLLSNNLEHLLVLPLFPQYSSSTTETARDQVNQYFEKTSERNYSFISHYAHSPHYLAALVKQIQQHHQPNHHLLFSFHGLPQAFADQGDPYPEHCQETVTQVAQALGLADQNWSLAYQSRLGYAKWLSPYTFETIRQLARGGHKQLSVICPGFSVDCLETLEEIKMRAKTEFLKHGGESFQYIPALNAETEHVAALAGILKEAL